MNYNIPLLPLSVDLETKEILKKTNDANKALAELKGTAPVIPNESILISTLSLKEAKDSSAIENIITTDDELYQSDFNLKIFKNNATKEVYNYSNALLNGFKKVKKNNFISINDILEIQSIIVENNAGFRKLPGTVLKNEQSGEIIYTPPQNPGEILKLMNNLEQFINDDSLSDIDPLIKMSIIHHQFESIHPFYDGNGRTGRILNILYLVKCGLLDLPVLYLSHFINKNKNEYYNLLQKTRFISDFNQWILYMLKGIEETSANTIKQIHNIKNLMQKQKNAIREKLPKIYSQDLINNIFRHPYTKISFVVRDLNISRITASRYLNELTKINILSILKIGKEKYYINNDFINLLRKD
ncbi:MAG TPA: Fic family protein [Ignavibacteria bacterium]|nr:Fic family protein [Ignavibacteria bacterium]